MIGRGRKEWWWKRDRVMWGGWVWVLEVLGIREYWVGGLEWWRGRLGLEREGVMVVGKVLERVGGRGWYVKWRWVLWGGRRFGREGWGLEGYVEGWLLG